MTHEESMAYLKQIPSEQLQGWYKDRGRDVPNNIALLCSSFTKGYYFSSYNKNIVDPLTITESLVTEENLPWLPPVLKTRAVANRLAQAASQGLSIAPNEFAFSIAKAKLETTKVSSADAVRLLKKTYGLQEIAGWYEEYVKLFMDHIPNPSNALIRIAIDTRSVPSYRLKDTTKPADVFYAKQMLNSCIIAYSLPYSQQEQLTQYSNTTELIGLKKATKPNDDTLRAMVNRYMHAHTVVTPITDAVLKHYEWVLSDPKQVKPDAINQLLNELTVAADVTTKAIKFLQTTKDLSSLLPTSQLSKTTFSNSLKTS